MERLAGLRQELAGLIKDADAAETRRHGSALAQALAGADGAVVVPIVTSVGGKLLIVTKESAGRAAPQRLSLIDLPELTTEKVDALVRGDGTTGGWLGAYEINYIEDKEERARRRPEWTAAVRDLGPRLWGLSMRP